MSYRLLYNIIFSVLTYTYLLNIILYTCVNEVQSIQLDMSNEDLSININFVDTHGMLVFLMPNNLPIDSIKWHNLFDVELSEGFVFESIVLYPLGDNKLGISLKCKNIIAGLVNYLSNQSYEVVFPENFIFPNWIKRTKSRVDKLIKLKTIPLNLSNDQFMENFNVVPYTYFLGIDITTNTPNTTISNVYWSLPNDCNIRQYFTKRVALSPHNENSIKVFVQYFDEDGVVQACTIPIQNVMVRDWLTRITQIYGHTVTTFSYYIDVDLENDDFLGDFEIKALTHEIYLFFNNYALYNKLFGVIRWGNYFTKSFEVNESIISIYLIPLGDYKIKLYFLDIHGTSEIKESYTLCFPSFYIFPKWLCDHAKQFLQILKSKVVYFEMCNDELPEQFDILQGFNTIELNIKKDCVDNTLIRLITWSNQMFFHLDSFSNITKIILTALGDNKLGIGILFKPMKEINKIYRKLYTVKIRNSKIPKWIKDKTEFTEALVKSEIKLKVDLSKDILDKELEVKFIDPSKAFIKVGLEFMDCHIIEFVYWDKISLFKCENECTIVKINVEIDDNKYKITTIYYDRNNKVLLQERTIEAKKHPKWALSSTT